MANSNRLGPAPWHPSSEPDQTPAERVLSALGEQTEPVRTNDLVQLVGLHANTVRAHLQELVEAGLVAVETVPPSGRGRPAHQYSITDAGRLVPRVNDPAFSEYRGLTTAFASYLAARAEDPSEESRTVGRAWGQQLASEDDLPDDIPGQGDAQARVIRLLAKLGFTPVPPATGEEDEGFALRTCPLLELAEEMPEVICQVHQGLVEGALKEYGAPGTQAILSPFSEPGACRLYLRNTQ